MNKTLLAYISFQSAAEVTTQDYLCHKFSVDNQREIYRKFYDRPLSAVGRNHTSSGIQETIDMIEFLGGADVVVAYDKVFENTRDYLALKEAAGRWGGQVFSVLRKSPEVGKEAVIYMRTATHVKPHADNSIDLQAKACDQYASARGWTVIRDFYDDAVSGMAQERPGLSSLLTFLEGRSSKTKVVVSDPGRIARDVELFLRVKLLIEEKGGELVIATQFSDSSFTPETQFLQRITTAVQEHHARQLKRLAFKAMKKHKRMARREQRRLKFLNRLYTA